MNEIKTAGFDAVIVINERLINEACAALFYSNFLTFNGSVDFSEGEHALPTDVLSRVPVTLKKCLKVDYRCKLLHEPYLDFRNDGKVSVHAHLRLYVWMLDGLEIRFDADLSLLVPLNFKPMINSDNTLDIDMKNCVVQQFKVILKGQDKELANLNVKNLFSNAIQDYLKNQSEPLTIKFPVFSSYLPYTRHDEDSKFSVEIAGVKVINGQLIVVAFYFLGRKNGYLSQLSDFAPNSNLALAVSKNAMQQTFDFFWNHTTWDKTFSFSKSFNLSVSNKYIKIGYQIIAFTLDMAVKLVSRAFSAGFLETDIDVDALEFNIFVEGDLDHKPEFTFLTGNRVKISKIGGGIKIRISPQLHCTITETFDSSSFIPDSWTPWKDDIVLTRKHIKVPCIPMRIDLKDAHVKSCVGELSLDEATNTMKIQVKEFKIDDNVFGSDCPLQKLNSILAAYVINKVGEFVIPHIPPFLVSPPVNEPLIPNVSSTISVQAKKLEITPYEAIAGAYVTFDKMQTITEPMPKYVGNVNTMEVHRLGCDCIYDTYETHQRGYYSLQKALEEGFDGCKKCLPAFHTR
ncbi:hypothetical protein [Fibrobacter succinogenes]|uniref:hypothetical protein n=1 Tax=Fibrobacter succinogenes TaxID=833 RepID=UPI001566CE6B|nr:hypothetical protein [Fibrobacter succinogenes]